MIWNEVITVHSSAWVQKETKNNTACLQAWFSNVTLLYSVVCPYCHQWEDEAHRKVNGKAHSDLFLHQILIRSELCPIYFAWRYWQSRKEKPGNVIAVFFINQRLFICKDALLSEVYINPRSCLPCYLGCQSLLLLHTANRKLTAFYKKANIKRRKILFCNTFLWISVFPLKFSCATDFPFLYTKITLKSAFQGWPGCT